MSFPWSAGELVTAAKLNLHNDKYVIKSALQNVISSTVLVNDTDLFVDLDAGRTYEVELNIGCSGDPTADIKVAYTTTGTITLAAFRTCFGPALATTNIADTTFRTGQAALATAVPYGVTASVGKAWETFIVSCTVAGRLQMQWAQNASVAVNTVVAAQSWLRARPIA